MAANTKFYSHPFSITYKHSLLCWCFSMSFIVCYLIIFFYVKVLPTCILKLTFYLSFPFDEPISSLVLFWIYFLALRYSSKPFLHNWFIALWWNIQHNILRTENFFILSIGRLIPTVHNYLSE